MPERQLGWLKTLSPGYFALAMATAIIAIACKQQGLIQVAEVLYWIGAIAYAVLAVLIVWRIIRFPRAVFSDITHPVSGYNFLTIPAATNVLGSASAELHGWWGLAWVLWWVSLPLLVLCLYVPLLSGLFRRESPSLHDGINGTWFLMTVGVQSIAVLGSMLLSHQYSDLLAVVCLAAHGAGLLLYLMVVTLIFARWTFARLEPGEIHGPAWIAAGAAAITTLAGASLITAAPHAPRLLPYVPFLEGMTIVAWTTAVFWFPVMVAVGIWRRLMGRVPLTYDPSVWGMIFPLGMFAAASFAMFHAVNIHELAIIYRTALVIAGVGWLVAMAGLIRHLAASLRRVQPAD